MSLSPPEATLPDKRKTALSLLSEFAAGCRALSGDLCGPFEPSRPPVNAPPSTAAGDADVRLSDLAAAALGDIRLLHRRMRLMHIRRRELARTEPAVMQQLTICCVRCGSTGECALELSEAEAGLHRGAWRNYCPNAAVLSTISVLTGTASVHLGPEFDGDHGPPRPEDCKPPALPVSSNCLR